MILIQGFKVGDQIRLSHLVLIWGLLNLFLTLPLTYWFLTTLGLLTLLCIDSLRWVLIHCCILVLHYGSSHSPTC